jgi:hypothetical protein
LQLEPDPHIAAIYGPERDGSDSQEGTAFIVVQNWHGELKRPGKVRILRA